MTTNIASPPRLILVVGKDITQARDIWKDSSLRDKYPREVRVKYVSRNPFMLDGLNPDGMLIVLVGQHWLNPIMESWRMRFFMNNGATVAKVHEQFTRPFPDLVTIKVGEDSGEQARPEPLL